MTVFWPYPSEIFKPEVFSPMYDDDTNNNRCLCSRKNMLVDRFTISLSLDDITHTENKDTFRNTKEPRSILKKSISMDATDMNEWKSQLLKQRGNSYPGVNCETKIETLRPLGSPTKNVTFADGNNLVKIRNFISSNDNMHLWSDSPYFQHFHLSMWEREETQLVGVQKRTYKKPNEIALCFDEPCQSSDFFERYKHRCVALEKCATRDRTIIGIILVKNIDFHKTVFVRYTIDDWNSSSDMEAFYVPNSNDGENDRFTFNLTMPKSCKVMHFAICYKVSTNEFWDNNYNKNYQIQDVLATSS